MIRDRGPIHELRVIAERRDGIFRRDHVRLVGMSNGSFDRLRRRGIVHRIHDGVWSFGCRPMTFQARCRAAVDAGGQGAVLSGEAAAWLWGLRKRAPRVIDVVVPRRHVAIDGVSVHQTRSLHASDVTTRAGIPVMTVARLLIELAGSRDEHQLCDTIDEAAYSRNIDFEELQRVVNRFRTRPGRARLVRAISSYLEGDGGTKSGLETRVVNTVAAVLVVPYEVNRRRWIGGKRIRPDLLIPDLAIAVECDGPGHERPTRQRQDRERDDAYRRDGYLVVRVRAATEVADTRRLLNMVAERQAALRSEQSQHVPGRRAPAATLQRFPDTGGRSVAGDAR